uniref:Uncharacterized protein n=1 Tax=Anguilla anguilla TaxID=7936 RepID=A0A0E9WQZ9_ANGAN
MTFLWESFQLMSSVASKCCLTHKVKFTIGKLTSR